MPASDILWNASQGDVFQSFATKRKSSLKHDVEMDMEASGDCKRRCMRETVGVEINHNDPGLNSFHQSQPSAFQQQHPYMPDPSLCTSTQTQPSIVNHTQPAVPQPPTHFVSVQQYYGGPQYQCHHVHANTPVVDRYPPHKTAETDMVMDLCDETYSAVPDQTRTEMVTAENQMDSDFTPNQQQYRNNTVGDEASPGSRVRCYCKPTWDGLMDVRPYVSDYY